MTDALAERGASLTEAARRFLESQGLSSVCNLVRMMGGRNNSVYRIDTEKGHWILKEYYQSTGDTRDRCDTEWRFIRYLWSVGVRMAPRPVACDRANHLALFEFVGGARVDAAKVDARCVASALEFVRRINEHRGCAVAVGLSPASEACFSIADHLACVDRRVARLREFSQGPRPSQISVGAGEFIESRLVPRWQEVRATIVKSCHRRGIDPVAVLPQCGRVLSPSDFGFHNAIGAAGGRLRFIDFEYAGWDDPAKLVCDFFCQPAAPVPRRYFDGFVSGVAMLTPEPRECRLRIQLLDAVYRCKWVCIVLNDFLPADARRRQMALRDDLRVRRERQLALARRMLDRLEDEACVAAD